MTRKRRIIVTAVVAPLAGLVLTAGACEQRGERDAPIDTRLQDNQAPYIINEPDTFMNMAVKCLGGDLVISHTRQGPPVVIVEAGVCKSGEAEKIGIPRVGGYVEPGS